MSADQTMSGSALLPRASRRGKTVSQVAHDNGVARAVGTVEEMRFVPVSLASAAVTPNAVPSAIPVSALELVIRDVTVRISGAVDVDSLRNVLAASCG